MHIAEHFLAQNLVLKVSGRLNLYSRKIFQAVMKNAESSNTECVVLDLSEVEYLDSVALGLLVLSQSNLSVIGIPMCLEPARPAFARRRGPRSCLARISITGP